MFFRRILNNGGYRTHCSQKLLSTVSDPVSDPAPVTVPVPGTDPVTPEKPKVKKNYVIPSELLEQVAGTSVEPFVKEIPKKYLRRVNFPPRSLLLINPETAKILASVICEHLLKNPSYVIETNPGLGLLTKELLDQGVPFIRLYEKRLAFTSDKTLFSILMSKYKDQLEHRQLDFHDVWMLLIRDQFHNEDLSAEYIADFPTANWESESYIQLLAMCPNRSCLSLMTHNFFRQTPIFRMGRPAFYMVLPSITWERTIFRNVDDASVSRYYSHHNVMLHLFFDYEKLGELPRRSFVPWPAKKKRKVNLELDSPVSIIRIEPKKDAYRYISREDMRGFWFFLKYMMRTRRHLVIKEFEQLVPGCGPKLIEKDINICTLFKELSPEKLADLFIMFRSWPEYDETLFNPSMLSGEEEEVKKLDDDNIDQEEDDDEGHVEKHVADVESVHSLMESSNELQKAEGQR